MAQSVVGQGFRADAEVEIGVQDACWGSAWDRRGKAAGLGRQGETPGEWHRCLSHRGARRENWGIAPRSRPRRPGWPGRHTTWQATTGSCPGQL